MADDDDDDDVSSTFDDDDDVSSTFDADVDDEYRKSSDDLFMLSS